MEGLGSIGGGASAPFTSETAAQEARGINAEAMKVFADNSFRKQVEKLPSIDKGAIKAVAAGLVSPEVVLRDGTISSVAKEAITKKLGLL